MVSDVLVRLLFKSLKRCNEVKSKVKSFTTTIFSHSTKLEKEKKQQAKESGFTRTEVAPQEVVQYLSLELCSLLPNALYFVKTLPDCRGNGERKTVFSAADVRGNL
jgi:hypothetical protein